MRCYCCCMFFSRWAEKQNADPRVNATKRRFVAVSFRRYDTLHWWGNSQHYLCKFSTIRLMRFNVNALLLECSKKIKIFGKVFFALEHFNRINSILTLYRWATWIFPSKLLIDTMKLILFQIYSKTFPNAFSAICIFVYIATVCVPIRKCWTKKHWVAAKKSEWNRNCPQKAIEHALIQIEYVSKQTTWFASFLPL